MSNYRIHYVIIIDHDIHSRQMVLRCFDDKIIYSNTWWYLDVSTHSSTTINYYYQTYHHSNLNKKVKTENYTVSQ